MVELPEKDGEVWLILLIDDAPVAFGPLHNTCALEEIVQCANVLWVVRFGIFEAVEEYVLLSGHLEYIHITLELGGAWYINRVVLFPLRVIFEEV